MAYKMEKISLVLVVFLTVLWDGTEAQSQSGCTTTLMRLTPCLNYVNGNTSTPSSSCCSQLSTIVQSQPQCLCLLLNGAASSYGYTINQTAALALPGACNVQTPPVSRCNDVNGPTASPSNPSDSPKTDSTKPSQPDLPSGAGSKNVPSTDANHVGGSYIKAPSILLGFFLFTVSSALSIAGF